MGDDIKTNPDMTEKEISDSGGSWWEGWVQSAKDKSVEVMGFVKKDLQEFATVVQTDAASAVASTADSVRRHVESAAAAGSGASSGSGGVGSGLVSGVADMLGRVANTMYIPPDDDGEIVLKVQKKHGVATDIFNRAEARVHALQADPSTYTEPLEPSPELEAWDSDFSADRHKTDISDLLVSRPEVRAIYAQCVPSQMPHGEFWRRYFWRLGCIRREEERRAALRRRAEVMVEEAAGVAASEGSAAAGGAAAGAAGVGGDWDDDDDWSLVEVKNSKEDETKREQDEAKKGEDKAEKGEDKAEKGEDKTEKGEDKAEKKEDKVKQEADSSDNSGKNPADKEESERRKQDSAAEKSSAVCDLTGKVDVLTLDTGTPDSAPSPEADLTGPVTDSQDVPVSSTSSDIVVVADEKESRDGSKESSSVGDDWDTAACDLAKKVNLSASSPAEVTAPDEGEAAKVAKPDKQLTPDTEDWEDWE